MDRKIVVVGSCNIDFVTSANRFPSEGETIHGTNFLISFGGKGANQAVAASKLGGNVYMVGRLGDDSIAEDYLQSFKSQNVNTTYLKKTEGVANGTACIIVAGGKNRIIVVAGANGMVSLQDLEDAKDVINDAAVLLCQLEIPEEVTIKALQMCNGISVLNAAPAVENADPILLTLPTVFCVNEIEATIFSGIPVTSQDDGKLAIDALLAKGCKSVLLTLGDKGAIYASQEQPSYLMVGTPKIEAVDSTAAGDMFLGAFAYMMAYKSELSMEEIIKASCCIASDCVTRLGAQISYPGPEILDTCISKKEEGETPTEKEEGETPAEKEEGETPAEKEKETEIPIEKETPTKKVCPVREKCRQK